MMSAVDEMNQRQLLEHAWAGATAAQQAADQAHESLQTGHDLIRRLTACVVAALGQAESGEGAEQVILDAPRWLARKDAP